MNSTANKIIDKNLNSHDSFLGSRKTLSSFVSAAKDFVVGCKDDLEMISFIRKFENKKKQTKSLKFILQEKVAFFIHDFPIYWRSQVKSYYDFIFSFVLFVLFLPIIFCVALAVRLTSKGPVFYKQERVGKNGQSFMIYKFRSMRVDAETVCGPVWAKDNDPRLTVIGSFLRKSHLDELPQLINVIKGEMSLIGPRPERPFFVEELKKKIPNYEKRLQVKPGITGLAQVRHKYDETIDDVKRKIKYDIVYIKKMCLLLDLKVLAWTVGVVFTGKGAH
jgi:exopolysaccharide biosynthesis polyprenyl glycosylphosphotransferase